jgi:hypothetical protein
MYLLMLFAHLVAVVTVFFVVGLMVAAVVRILNAATPHEALRACSTITNVEKSMALVTAALLVTGGYMTHDRWTWTTPWIDAGIAGLIAMTLFGAAFLGPRASKLHAILQEAAQSGKPLPIGCMHAARTLLSGNGLNLGLAIGVMYLMVAKPSGVVACIATLLIGAAVGFTAFGFAQRSATPIRSRLRPFDVEFPTITVRIVKP